MDARPVCDYADLIAAIRDRIDELSVAFHTVDAVAGLTLGHTGKILNGKRGFGPASFLPLASALGLQLVVTEDPEALARVQSRLVARKSINGHLKRRHRQRENPAPAGAGRDPVNP